jgi:hypothetical protein
VCAQILIPDNTENRGVMTPLPQAEAPVSGGVTQNMKPFSMRTGTTCHAVW